MISRIIKPTFYQTRPVIRKVLKAGLATEARSDSLASKVSSYKVLIIGGGSGGISVSSNLIKQLGENEVAIIEPSPVHSYQPLWTFVGAGLKTLKESQKPTSDVIPKGVQWVQNKALAINPELNLVELENGQKISYEYLVVAPGIELKWDKVKGLKEALAKGQVASNYSASTVEKTWELLNQTTKGNALFTMPATPVKCAGAPQKIAYLADAHFRQRNVRDNINLQYFTGIGKIFAIEKYGKQLTSLCQEKDIKVNTLHDLKEVDYESKVATFSKVGTEDKTQVSFDFLHVTPPMGAFEFLKSSNLTNTDGFVDVDKDTLVHTKYDNVFSLGDASSLPTSKTAAAITSQTKVLSHNLLSSLKSTDKKDSIDRSNWLKYDGYTSCPLLVGNSELVLAEFSGYTGQPQETFFYDQSKPSKLSYFVTSEILPQFYWNGLLKGKWHGPQQVRGLTNPLNSN